MVGFQPAETRNLGTQAASLRAVTWAYEGWTFSPLLANTFV